MSLLVPYQDSQYPMYSSGLFLIPAMYSFQKKQNFHGVLLLTSAVISINYWRCATYVIFKNILCYICVNKI